MAFAKSYYDTITTQGSIADHQSSVTNFGVLGEAASVTEREKLQRGELTTIRFAQDAHDLFIPVSTFLHGSLVFWELLFLVQTCLANPGQVTSILKYAMNVELDEVVGYLLLASHFIHAKMYVGH